MILKLPYFSLTFEDFASMIKVVLSAFGICVADDIFSTRKILAGRGLYQICMDVTRVGLGDLYPIFKVIVKFKLKLVCVELLGK